jgi:quercetin dioxygenase-like cupin family protein
MRVHHTQDGPTEPGPPAFFAGDVSTQVITQEDGLDVVLVSFSPGARTYWHTHESAQVLHVTEGKGILATRQERHEVGPGDIVHVSPGEEHWHGATPDSPFTHLSIRTTGETEWTGEDPLASS